MSLQEISDMVSSEAKERDIDAKLKERLEILGNACTSSAFSDHYVAFSQFPIAKGVVDFAVFTGPSRLTVTFIEVKGADFFFENVLSTPHAEIVEAYTQILSRFDYYNRDYRQFHDSAHECLRTAQQGTYNGNVLVGPKGNNLEVDLKKDVVVRGLVIGGRTRDDNSESKLRTSLEKANSGITFESWPSWLRKQGDVSGILRDQPLPV